MKAAFSDGGRGYAFFGCTLTRPGIPAARMWREGVPHACTPAHGATQTPAARFISSAALAQDQVGTGITRNDDSNAPRFSPEWRYGVYARGPRLPQQRLHGPRRQGEARCQAAA